MDRDPDDPATIEWVERKLEQLEPSTWANWDLVLRAECADLARLCVRLLRDRVDARR